MSEINHSKAHAYLARELAAFEDLLRTLVPRAGGFAFLTPSHEPIWKSGEIPERTELLAGLPARPQHANGSQFLRVDTPSGLTFVHCLPSEAGFLLVVFDHKAAPQPTEAMLSQLLAPLLPLLGTTFNARAESAELKRQTARLNKKLQLIFQLDNQAATNSKGHSSLSQLVATAARSLRVGYSVMIMPEKRIRFSVTHPSWKDVNRKILDKTTILKLLPAVSSRREPVVLDVATPPAGLAGMAHGYQIIACPIREGRNRVAGVLALFAQIEGRAFNSEDLSLTSHIARRAERVVELNYDPMTGLMNRDGFEAHLKTAYAELKTHNDEHSLIFFDLDQMQLFNDTFDQKAGDEVLVRFASELSQLLPDKGVASRMAGDHFSVLLPNTPVSGAVELAEKMRQATHKMSYLKGDKSHQITVSAGVAPLRINDEGCDGALIAPKVACTAAKDHGRDRVEVYDQDNHSIVRRVDDMQIVGQVHSALSTGDLQLVAQPIVSLNDDTARSYYEILVRMTDSSGASLKPAEFFSAAERYQLMPQLDRCVITKALEAIAEHKDDPQLPRFAINLSGQSLQDDSLLEFVTQKILETGVAPSSLCFEITETAAVSNMLSA